MPKKCSCGTRASFNIQGETNPIFCIKCKTSEMINVIAKRCSCGTQSPKFNLPGENIGVCCKICKTNEMIDVVNKKCPCGKTPNFNVPGQKPICCAKCKREDMIDVKHVRCSCGSLSPKFNVPEETIGVFCVKCKTPEMVDVNTKKCPCGKQPSFNIPGKTGGVCCKSCKTDKMINVVSKKCLCGFRPHFNAIGETIGVCCARCKTPEMINVDSRICPGYDRPCPVRTHLVNGYDYCMSCDPNDDRRKRYKMFEEAFFAYVKDKINVHKREFVVTFDPTETANKFARLDGVVFGDGIIVCLEVDENGHRDYECDEHRMHLVTAELLQKYPEHVVSWVRVNPTVKSKRQWSETSVKKREKRFDDVVIKVLEILEMNNTGIFYIGF